MPCLSYQDARGRSRPLPSLSRNNEDKGRSQRPSLSHNYRVPTGSGVPFFDDAVVSRS